MVGSSSEGNKVGENLTGSQALLCLLSRPFVVSKWSEASAGEKQTLRWVKQRASPGNFILLVRHVLLNGELVGVGGRCCTLEVTGVEFWTSQTHFRIGSVLLLLLGYGKLLSEGISFLPLKWFFPSNPASPPSGMLEESDIICVAVLSGLLTDGGNCRWKTYHRRRLPVTMRI